MKSLFILLLAAASFPARGVAWQPFINWNTLRNPVLAYHHWSIKDAALAYRNGQFYVFFSAFYMDHGRIRSHVVEVRTADFKTYSKPILDFDGEEDGWIGMCSPDVRKAGSVYEVSFNSWGDKSGKPDQVFYMTSLDLVRWSARRPLARRLTAGKQVIDAAIADTGSGFYLIWKQNTSEHHSKPRVAFSKSLAGPWSFVGNGDATLTMPDGKENGLIHENFTFVLIRGKWRLLSSDYPHGHHEYLYAQLHGGNWLDWGNGMAIRVATQGFNKFVHADAAAIYNWRKKDGYVYLIYAGRNEGTTYLHRGWNRLGLSRSKDLIHWVPAGLTR
ncbi:MAG: hypothetical protein KGM47_04240 [Acidobacteriota bacterium]|nr:hypothetical protein [Acidobacteriota bacterium]